MDRTDVQPSGLTEGYVPHCRPFPRGRVMTRFVAVDDDLRTRDTEPVDGGR